MNRDELIYKWLNHELNGDELKAFKKLEEYESLNKMNEITKGLKAPDYNTSEELQKVLSRIETKKAKKKNWMPIVASIASIFVICFGFYYYSTSLDTTFTTLAAQKQTITLPDGSIAELNASSQLSFNEHGWKNNREINLDGEAFFKVLKGSKFEVKTNTGTVTVLGTQFNINQRKSLFEVVCYEGLVNVNYSAFDVKLQPGNSFLIRDGKLIATEKENLSAPSWTANYSLFQSVPYKEVVAEFERQFDVQITLKSIDGSQLFTGSFDHNNMETALKSITLPLNLTYSKTNRTITLKRE